MLKKTRKTRKNKKLKRKSTRRRYKQKGGNNIEDDSHCKYVCSHGIMKASKKINGVFYVKSDHINNFSIPNYPFVLVTGNEDTTMPDDFNDKANEILNNPNLIHWYAQNLVKHDNPKLTAIPIGLDYHTIAENKPGYEWWGEKQTPVKQEEFLINLNKPNYSERERKIYCNFLSSIRGRYGGKDRKEALEQIPNELLIKEETNIARNETWKNMIKYSFVLSPHGNGLDCHRTWEALVLGCIPIVKKSPIDGLYDDLPVLIVNNWSDINKELLDKTIEEFKNKTFNNDKLTLAYWVNKFKESISEKSLKYVITLCSNEPYIDKAIQTIEELRSDEKGCYKGDIVLFHDGDLENNSKVNELVNKYNVILKSFPSIDTSNVLKIIKRAKNIHYPAGERIFQYHKFYMFDVYFKKWDVVLYVDVGMRIFNDVNRILHLDTKNKLLAHSNFYPNDYNKNCLEHLFNLKNEPEIVEELKKNFDNNKKDCFQSTMLMYDTNIIDKNTVNKLIELMNKYPISTANDEGIINLYFSYLHDYWNPIPIKDSKGLLYDFMERFDHKKNEYVMLKYPKT
jgi:hypothetical protein